MTRRKAGEYYYSKLQPVRLLGDAGSTALRICLAGLQTMANTNNSL